MNFTAGQIADQINGTIVGDRDVDIFNISKIEEGTKGSLTFLANPKYTEFIYSTNASAAIVSELNVNKEIQIKQILVDDTKKTLVLIANRWRKNFNIPVTV